MSFAGLLLADSRFPAGGHAYSGGIEAAVSAGTVTGTASLEAFLRGRLRTAGMVAAGLAAAACAHSLTSLPGAGEPAVPAASVPADHPHVFWDLIDAHADARTPSPAQREASRRQGRALLRAGRVAWPDGQWPQQAAPHHAVVLGAAAAAAGCQPEEAAAIAAYQAVAGPAGAAVRLLALDPMEAAGLLARLAREVDEVAERGTACAHGPLDDLPYPSAPALDLLAEAHIRAEVRLFES